MVLLYVVTGPTPGICSTCVDGVAVNPVAEYEVILIFLAKF
jgi:hypothetical protein